MWPACRRGARALRALMYHLVGAMGSSPLRLMTTESWQRPIDEEDWEAMIEVWAEWFEPFDKMVLYRPPQADRTGFAALLLKEGRGVGFVKCRREWDFAGEANLIEAVAGARSFTTPKVVGVSTGPVWSTMGLTALQSRLHSARLPRAPVAVAEEVSGLLDHILPGDPGNTHWEVIHGDMGPWNLRYHRDIGPILFDWELGRRAPPGADIVFHTAASKAMGLTTGTELTGMAEAAQFWMTEIPSRFADTSQDRRLASEMLAELRRMS